MPSQSTTGIVCSSVCLSQSKICLIYLCLISRVVKLVKTIETPPPSRKIKCNNAKEPQSVYYCHLCGSEYIMKYNLEVHLERQHKEEERNALPQ